MELTRRRTKTNRGRPPPPPAAGRTSATVRARPGVSDFLRAFFAALKLANTLIKDHSKSYEDTVKLAKELGIDYSKEPSPTEQWELKAVSTFSGEQFNHWYALLEVKDHQQDIQLAEDEVKDGCNEKVRNNAKEELPVLRYHLELAEQALKANP